MTNKILTCPDCGSPMAMVFSALWGWFYQCSTYPLCFATHSVHQDTKEPMGVPAPWATRRARIAAHYAFDRLWKLHPIRRKEAYEWMREKMGLEENDAHIGMFTKEQCEQLIELVGSYEKSNQAEEFLVFVDRWLQEVTGNPYSKATRF